MSTEAEEDSEAVTINKIRSRRYDYLDYYFNGSKPWAGRCFIILYNDEEIGQINYNEIDAAAKSTEIYIWLADRKFTHHGFGPEAIKLLCAYLKQNF